MLSVLSIKNFALIERLEIDFSNHFTIITGETGAGKSILLGALGLILGKRADLSSLKAKDEKCVIEAHFQIGAYNLKPLFENLDIDYEETTIVRREILPSGKSRAFVNDSPVNLSALQDLGVALIDIHSQHQTQELSDEIYQIQILDAVANNSSILSEYQRALSIFKKGQTQLKSLQTEQADWIKERDYHTFMSEELFQAQLKAGEQEVLESDYEKLNNIEFVKEALSKSWSLLNEDQIGVNTALKEVRTALQRIAGFSSDFKELFERIHSVEIELNDVTNEMELQTEALVHNPEQLRAIDEKLQLIYALQKKHQVQSIAELLVIESELNEKLFSGSDLDTRIDKLLKDLKSQEDALKDLGAQLTQKRKEAVPVLQEKLLELLRLLGMPNAAFQFEIKPNKSFLNNGMDDLQLLFSANKGIDFGLLKKVASGGELSRIMLAIKAILTQYSHLPTIIFDEIDTGVSGEIADKMGVIMQRMSQKMQVLSITHLPQIAAKGDHHYKVFKTTVDDSTTSQLVLLNDEERIVEIAQMLSGKDISESALVHAKELLNK
ncbi:DNA repair protein RecN [Flavobacterium sp. NKUCC04_CG]|uniref:DNA repair protein RecN n=1 Tax=Flavobacterium sp. NKUCC04_CG TaxID=2842121 RepID=UPI001C5BF1A9|nr:DNA repair protein RecN [Flavobacterium sp. NKUCC04_CG]MBW3519316.1 DNA repair protein RecN [Flavobacterium sp. NKUCC04_CG]